MYISAVIFFPVVLLGLVLAGALGTAVRRRFPGLVREEHTGQFSAVQAAVLALLGLLLGFSFSMAVGRYDNRKNTEIGEANAIGTAFSRTGSLPMDEARSQRQLIRRYVVERVAFYNLGTNWAAVAQAAARAANLQGQMVRNAEAALGPARDAVSNGYLSALTAVGDAAESRQAALENRIPTMAWALLLTMSSVASFLIGMGLTRWHGLLLGTLPLVVAASLTLVWDLDHPRAGVVRVRQDSMHRLQEIVNGATE